MKGFDWWESDGFLVVYLVELNLCTEIDRNLVDRI